MSTPQLVTGLFIFSAFPLFSLSVLAQGNLAPPGSPGPTMNTLGQIGSKVDAANGAINQNGTAIGQINTKVDQTNTTLGQTNSGVTQVSGKVDQANSGIGAANTAIGAANSGIGEANTGINQANTGIGQANTAIGQANTGIGQANTGIGQANTTLGLINAKGEARTPISSLPFTISASGSYYLTGNLQFSAASGHAITINADNVTLDLNGFTLSSTAAVTGYAIALNSAANIAVKNGVIAGNTTVTISGSPPSQTWTITQAGFGSGIRTSVATPINCQFSHLLISGCRVIGLDAGDRATVDHVTATLNGSVGISASNGSVTGSTASSNGNNGITASSIASCTANSNHGDGISASNGSVTGATANSNGVNGITAVDGSVTSSTALFNGGNGIIAGSITNSTGSYNGNIGISATSVTNSTATFNVSFGIAANSVTSSAAIFNRTDGIRTNSLNTGVVAFCTASNNNTANNGSLDINATGATRTGNNPTP